MGFLGVLYTAYRCGYDLTETAGFVGINIGLFFGSIVIFGLVLTACAALVNLIRRRTHLPVLSVVEKRIAIAYFVTLLVQCSAVGFALWHPLGWFWSVTIAVPVYAVGLFVARRLYKGLPQEDMMRLQDRILAPKEEPNPLYFIP